jgi:hypothetical protein
LADAERERAAIGAGQLVATARDDLKGRRARLEELQRALVEIAPATAVGEQLIDAAAVALQRLAEYRSRDERATTLRVSTTRFAQD